VKDRKEDQRENFAAEGEINDKGKNVGLYTKNASRLWSARLRDGGVSLSPRARANASQSWQSTPVDRAGRGADGLGGQRKA
jgi:hypothetical protein